MADRPMQFYADPRLAAAYDAGMGAEADAMDDTPFYRRLAQEAQSLGPVLELGCGTGRVTVPIAQDGVEIVGLDNAAAMLDLAAAKAAEAGVDVTRVEADMRDFDLGRRFGLVIIPYRSFLHLLTDADQAACLRCVRDHLLPGGRLALNFFAPPFEGGADADPVISRIHRHMQLRYVSRLEMEALLAAAGFEVEALYGGFQGEPVAPRGGELVWIARLTAT